MTHAAIHLHRRPGDLDPGKLHLHGSKAGVAMSIDGYRTAWKVELPVFLLRDLFRIEQRNHWLAAAVPRTAGRSSALVGWEVTGKYGGDVDRGAW